jgi:hypothetical protein
MTAIIQSFLALPRLSSEAGGAEGSGTAPEYAGGSGGFALAGERYHRGTQLEAAGKSRTGRPRSRT